MKPNLLVQYLTYIELRTFVVDYAVVVNELNKNKDISKQANAIRDYFNMLLFEMSDRNTYYIISDFKDNESLLNEYARVLRIWRLHDEVNHRDAIQCAKYKDYILSEMEARGMGCNMMYSGLCITKNNIQGGYFLPCFFNI